MDERIGMLCRNVAVISQDLHLENPWVMLSADLSKRPRILLQLLERLGVRIGKPGDS